VPLLSVKAQFNKRRVARRVANRDDRYNRVPMRKPTARLGLCCALLCIGDPSAQAHAPQAQVTCSLTENGQAATGVISILKSESEIAAGACGHTLSIPPGEYAATLRLDGALDSPEQHQPLHAKANSLHTLKADFATSTLEVRVTSAGRRAAGIAIIRRDERQLATLGSGVSAHLSAGTYSVVVRYRSQERDLGEITLKAGQKCVLEATFE